MKSEFTKHGRFSVSSNQGFTVEILPLGEVIYEDSVGKCSVAYERLIGDGLLIDPRSIDREGEDLILKNLIRAVEHLGFFTRLNQPQ